MTTAITAAVSVLGGVAAWLLFQRDESLRRARLLMVGCGTGSFGMPAPPLGYPGRCAEWSRRWGSRWRLLLGPLRTRGAAEVLCLTLGTVSALWLRSPVPALAGALAVPAVRRWLRGRAAERAAAECRAGVIELCSALAGELRTGRPPNTVLAQAVGVSAWLARADQRGAVAGVLAAARFGGDVPAALRKAAATPGAEGLAGAAACWQVAVDSGSGLGDGLDRVAAALMAEEHQREELRAQLAGPKSTAALLAVLPVFGLLLGSALGAGPLDVLLHTGVGLVCLVSGLALELAGLAWTGRIIRGAS